MGFTATGTKDSLDPEVNSVKGSFSLAGAVFAKHALATCTGACPGGHGLHVDAN